MNTDGGNIVAHERCEYEVAISFLAQDSSLAENLSGRLKEFCSVFLFTRNQEEMAGTDGLETLAEVFRSKSQLVVILHRQRWGDTPWTRVEAQSIKDRSLEHGWNEILVVKLEKTAENPKGFPSTRIYFDYEVFGFEEMLVVIKATLVRLGSNLRHETVIERAERLAKDDKFRKCRNQLLNSYDGVQKAKQLLNSLFQEIQKHFMVIQDSLLQHKLQCLPDGNSLIMRLHEQYTSASLSVRWMPYACNSLEKSCLEVQEFNGLVPTSQETICFPIEKPRRLKKYVFEVDYTSVCEWIWKEKHRDGERTYTSNILAEYILKLFLGLMDRVSKGELR